MDNLSRNIIAAIDAKPRDLGAYRDLMGLQEELDHSGTLEHDTLLECRRVISAAIRGGWLDAEGLDFMGGALRVALTLDARFDLDAYMQAMEFDRTPESRLWLPRRNQLMRLCRELQWFETDPDASFLSVSMPPRTGKSSTCSMAMTWHLGRDPMHANLMTAHSDKLTKHFYQQCLQFVSDPEYRFKEIFPDSQLVWQSSEDEAFSLRKHGAYASCTCRSVEGTLTGAVEVGEGGWLYADDLVKDLEEAMSPRRLQGKWEAYVNQCYDRRKKGAKQLMVGTRWDVQDPIGRMVDLHRGEDGFHVLTIPALDPKTGESNFDYLYGVGFDRTYYLDMKRTTDQATYAAKYDGRPYVRQGQLYSPDSLERYLSLPEGEPARIVAVVDTKGAGEDYQAAPIAAKWDSSPKWFIIDFFCDNSTPEVVNRRLAQCLAKNGVQTARFESNAAGGRVADDVDDMLREMGALCAVSKKYTGSNKATRILASSPWVIANCVFRDDSLYSAGSGYEIAMNQLCSYVLDGKNLHDDAPDSLSMLAEMLSGSAKASAKAIRRPF
jgi:predicted phage terminase large subunit-like protein